MKYILKKQDKKRVSSVVLRAIARINDYENRKAYCSVVWNGKSINHFSITS